MQRALVVPTLLVIATLGAGCALPDEPPADVVATFYPLGWLSRELAGDDLHVVTLVPAGVEPHDWEPTGADVARLAEAKLLVVQGAGFEPWLDGLLASLGERAPPVVVTTEGLDLAEGAHDEHDEHDEHEAEDEGGLDPHTWLDPILFAQQANRTATALMAAFPDERAGIEARRVAVQAELAAIHEAYVEGLSDCELDVVIANHDAYGYLERRYDFDVVAVSGLSPEAEPSPRDLERAIEAAREHNVTIIFFEDLVSPRVAQVVAEEVGAQTRVLSPIEGLPRDAPRGTDYPALMRQNLVNLREAMRCP